MHAPSQQPQLAIVPSAGRLSPEHRRKLRGSALTDAQVDALGCWSDADGHLFIPYLHPDGMPQVCRDGKPFVRFRRSDAEIAADPKGGKYRTRSKQGCRLYHSPLAIAAGRYAERLADVHVPLRITEGEWKTAAASVHDPKRITIGLGGVNSWKDRYDDGTTSRPVVELEEIPVERREVRICFDSDIQANPKVRAALQSLALWLHKRKAHVLLELLPNAPKPGPDGKPVRLGIDDLIAGYGADLFLRIADMARPALALVGKGEDAQLALNLPDEPGGDTATYVRAVYLTGLLGRGWRRSDLAKDAWWRWAGNHWEEVVGNDAVLAEVEEFLECQRWRVARSVGHVAGLLAAFRRQVGSFQPQEHPGLLPCRNGLLDVATRVLLPHDPGLCYDWCLEFDWSPLAVCDPIRDFLHEALPDPESVNILRAAARRMLAGPRWKGFVEIFGPADSGKSVVANLLVALVGRKNTAAMTLETFEDRKQRFEVVRLRGKRLAVFNEAQRYHGPLENLKSATGGDTLRGELKGSNQIADFVFCGLVLVVGNSPIGTTEASAAVVNRRRSICTPRTVPEAERRELLEWKDRQWEGELAGYLPGFLAWVLDMPSEEAEVALRRHINSPARIQAEILMLLDTDPLARWANAHLLYDPGISTGVGTIDVADPANSGKLHAHYFRVISGEGITPLRQNFKRNLVTLLRDTLGLPLPEGSPSSGAYRDVRNASIVPCIRFRQAHEDDIQGIVEYALWRRLSPETSGGSPEAARNTRAPSSEASETPETSGDSAREGLQGVVAVFPSEKTGGKFPEPPKLPTTGLSYSGDIPAEPLKSPGSAPAPWLPILRELQQQYPEDSAHGLMRRLRAQTGQTMSLLEVTEAILAGIDLGRI